MTGKAGWMLAGAILVAMGSSAQAQVGITIGNPYYGRGVVIGTPGYGYGYGAYRPSYAPATTYYSSGYAGYAPVGVYPAPVVVPSYGYVYRGYGYRPYRRVYGRRW